MVYVLFAVGFLVLIKGADIFIDGSVGVAKALGVPGVIIGLTIVAVGTSAPEFLVSLNATLAGSNEIAVSNVFGSNIFNVLVVLGICSLFRPLKADKDILSRDLVVLLVASAALVFYLLDRRITRLDGFSLVFAMIAYLIFLCWYETRNKKETRTLEKRRVKKGFLIKNTVLTIIGLVLVVGGSRLVVNNGVVIAGMLGLSETFIGLTVISMGTSLPELMASVSASRKGEYGIALGNVIGSNVFNLLFIIGACGAACPLWATADALIDSIAVVGVTLLLMFVCIRNKGIEKRHGIGFLMLYGGYMVYIFFR